jgi:hypothetical protein
MTTKSAELVQLLDAQGVRAFEHFPPQSTCPVCGTADNLPCVLVVIDYTEKDGIAKAQPFHLKCAVVSQYDRELNIAYRRGSK